MKIHDDTIKTAHLVLYHLFNEIEFFSFLGQLLVIFRF